MITSLRNLSVGALAHGRYKGAPETVCAHSRNVIDILLPSIILANVFRWKKRTKPVAWV